MASSAMVEKDDGACDRVGWSEVRVKELEDVVANLLVQNQILRKENCRLTMRLAEIDKDLRKKSSSQEIGVDDPPNGTGLLPLMPSRVEDAGQKDGGVHQRVCQIEITSPDTVTTCTGSTAVHEKGRRKKKKNAAANDMSHYATRHVALNLMYLGSRYHGFASQAGLQRTVESELFTALQRTRLITGTAAEANYSRCGRTDKGVSAVGQVIALYLRSKQKLQQQEKCAPIDSAGQSPVSEISESCGVSGGENRGCDAESATPQKDATKSNVDRVAMARASRSQEELFASTASDEDEFDYVAMLNRALPEDIRVLGWCPVPQGFNARFSCLYREYKYFFVDNGLNIDAMKAACKKFEGEHDFSNFCKMDAANVHNYVRTISKFDILPFNEMWGGKRVWIMRVKGTAFLWHQVRCMAAVLFMVGSGYESPTIVEEMLVVQKYVRKPQYIMAPETPLLLFHCGFQGLSFHCHPDAVKRLRLHLEALLQDSVVNSSLLLQGLLELPSPESEMGEMARLGEVQSKKSIHIPLLKRPTEPTYEERRRRQCAEHESEAKE